MLVNMNNNEKSFSNFKKFNNNKNNSSNHNNSSRPDIGDIIVY